MIKNYFFLWALLAFAACQKAPEGVTLQSYHTTQDTGLLTGGVKIIDLVTPTDTFKLWTKRIGNNPKIKLLLLSGGPGISHEYFECMESYLPAEGIEFIYYDQLGTGLSDNPNDSTYWELDRYVEEVETVRKALGLNKDNFFLLGHSWGGILAMQYALKYQDNLKGLVISNMMASCIVYGNYAKNKLAKDMDPAVLSELMEIEKIGDFSNPRYMELLQPHFYNKHICRLPLDQWPEPVTRALGKTNQSLYVTMQGPSEFGISGRLAKWDVLSRLVELEIPILTIGATHDTMDPQYMRYMATLIKDGTYLLCPNGSHMAMWDDQKVYMKGLINFLKTKGK